MQQRKIGETWREVDELIVMTESGPVRFDAREEADRQEFEQLKLKYGKGGDKCDRQEDIAN